MSDGQAWLIPRGADGGEFKYEAQFLQSITKPLGESTKAARDIASEYTNVTFKAPGLEENTGASDVTEAVNDFLVAETKDRYQAMMLERQKQHERDHLA